MSEYTPIFRSPIVKDDENRKSKIVNLKVTDLTGAPVVLIQGEAATAVLKKQLKKIPANPGDVVEVKGGVLARLTRDEFYLFGLSPGAQLPSAAELDESLAAAKLSARATDFTHRTALLKLSGPAAAEMLNKICGLDFHDTVFPTMQVKQSSAAKIKTLILRHDEGGAPVYHLHLSRPYGQYFWEIVWDAGQEFGIGVGQ
jgi:sarcosine oxidase subunit alpha